QQPAPRNNSVGPTLANKRLQRDIQQPNKNRLKDCAFKLHHEQIKLRLQRSVMVTHEQPIKHMQREEQQGYPSRSAPITAAYFQITTGQPGAGDKHRDENADQDE